ncbi:recombination associated protein RdgC [Mariprofundus ferrinatatus]|uniref:Recombination-associated protein RdgC n=1 Tax=Mariprofundus ferrinatatus TaxID=1921087 RepID=A0A2K8L4J8_9PROT|nr:recombination-associated protein RdgC [Mariprofundus ferrinatatus]ATX82032.1 recombination associated protein RdgC [Mariprofundus ferrinatatus]
MWFKNIHFYQFEAPFKLTGQQLNEALFKQKARRCGQMEMTSQGWCPPLGMSSEMLVHQSGANLMICLRREEKVLPSSLVRERVEEQALAIEAEAGRPVGRKERRDIKDAVLQELMPKALVRASQTFAAILPESGWLIINAASAKKCEELMETLRKTLGTLNVVIPATEESPEGAMTRWLQNEASLPQGFSLEDACELYAATDAGGVIRCRNVDISRDEVRAHLAAGYRVRRMAMNWQERMSFILHEDLSVHRMRFDSAVLDESEGDDDASRFDADFTIMASELAEFIPILLAALNSKA